MMSLFYQNVKTAQKRRGVTVFLLDDKFSFDRNFPNGFFTELFNFFAPKFVFRYFPNLLLPSSNHGIAINYSVNGQNYFSEFSRSVELAISRIIPEFCPIYCRPASLLGEHSISNQLRRLVGIGSETVVVLPLHPFICNHSRIAHLLINKSLHLLDKLYSPYFSKNIYEIANWTNMNELGATRAYIQVFERSEVFKIYVYY